VAGRLQVELQQRRPFRRIEEEAMLNIQRTADVLGRRFLDLIASHDLTNAQYNVLRILRGAGEEGLGCKEIGARLVQRDPDITRLVDRLEKRRLVTRTRSPLDRRAIKIRISPEGLQLLADLDQPVQDLHEQTLGFLAGDKVNILIEILEDIRAKLDQPDQN
jgi:DNA-binding MarR family transcriptional regulator